MDRRLYLLRVINENNRVSQRQLAKTIGLSLGTINALMQQLEIEGWIDSVAISGKSTEYTITEIGHQQKAELSRLEAVHCYQFIGEIKTIIKNNLEKMIKDGVKHFVLIGEDDEIFKLVKLAIKDLSRFNSIDYIVKASYDDIDSNTLSDKTVKHIAWDELHTVEKNVYHILAIK